MWPVLSYKLSSPRRFLPFALYILFATGAACAGEHKLPGIIGVDNRESVASSETSFDAVGHINVAGYRSKSICTGTLIAPDRVVTAAHCLVRQGSGKPVPRGNIHFVAGVRGAKRQAHAKAKCVRYAQTPFKPVPRFSGHLLKDFAIVTLDRKITGVTPLELLANARIPKGYTLVHPSYPRDSRYQLKAHFGCHLRGERQGLWLTNCDTNYASSGGPVLARVSDRYYLVAVKVGFVKREFTVAVPVSAWRELLARRDCS